VTTTIHPDTPITEGLTPERIADLIDQAAQLIYENGLEIGDLWTDAIHFPYEPGASCCTAGALAAACGYRDAIDVETAFVGIGYYDVTTDAYVELVAHPVFAAVMAELDFEQVEDLYNWSDTATDTEVVGALRDAATAIRARAQAAAS
jgi:hypothetical protein